MKLQLYTLFLCLVFFSCGQSRNTEPSTSVVEDSAARVTAPETVAVQPTTVEQIKQRYADINAKLQGSLLDSMTYKYDCNGERSGTVTYFSDKGKLTMIKHNYNEYSHFEATDQYFISNDHLFFAHFRRSNWSFESGQAADGATKDNITEQDFMYRMRNHCYAWRKNIQKGHMLIITPCQPRCKTNRLPANLWNL